MEAGPPYDKQRIQMGLRSGNTVLIYFRSGVGHYQSVLIALAADLHFNKLWQGQHKFWKYVSPIRTYFAWLPEQLARTYCGAALDRHSGLPHGEVHHLQGSESDFRHSMVFQNIYHIGDTKSAQETGGVPSHVPGKVKVVLWNPMHRQLTSQWTAPAPETLYSSS